MRLFIAEKPNVAKAIAGRLGVVSRGEGYIECSGGTRVTWCYGHMLELAEPDDYTPDDVPRGKNGKKLWRVDELPIIPTDWKLQPRDDKDSNKQLAHIGKLLKAATHVVNAGDPDREGQLLVDEVLDHFGYRGSVSRYWSAANDETSVQRALDALKNNQDYHGWADAARGRAKADWLIGMNLSRAYTLRAQRGGSRALIPVGRVQTPTLALVVARDREIEKFKPLPYYTIDVLLRHEGGTFRARWQIKDDQEGTDSDGRLIDAAIADRVVASLDAAAGAVDRYEQSAKSTPHPLPYKLDDMTADAARAFGYTAEDVLKALQSLYDTHALTTYPRVDCAYLPESQHAEAPQILAALRVVNPELGPLIDKADPRIKSRAFSDAKMAEADAAHHGIIPTQRRADRAALTDKERNIYGLIVRAYIAQFFPLHEYQQTTLQIGLGGETFVASGRVVTCNGWRDAFVPPEDDADKDSGDEDKSQQIPAMRKGDAVQCLEARRVDRKTKAPPRFDEGSLMLAMASIHKFVANPEHRKLLKESDGIGTPATRPPIITELRERGFIEAKGKKIVSTMLGRSIIDALPEALKSPVITALFERTLMAIQKGGGNLPAFIAQQEKFIRDQVAAAGAGAVTISGGADSLAVSQIHKCMNCGAGLIRRPSTKHKGSFWWSCSGYPNCSCSYPDAKGRPDYSVKRTASSKEATP